MNTQATRYAIGEDEFSWLENAMPIGSSNLKVVPGPSAILVTLTGETINYWLCCNINSTDYMFCFCNSGAAYQINLNTYSSTKFATSGTFSSSGVAIDQWKNERIVIIDPVKGYFTWDGTSLCGNGGVTAFTLTNTGSGYTSSPTVSFYGGGGVSATANLVGNTVGSITVNTSGAGYVSVPTVVISGGGGSGATAHATLAGNTVATIVVDTVGSGYTTAPTVSFYGGGTSQGGGSPTATATVSGGAVSNIVSTAPGQTFNTGTGATATATLAGNAISTVAVNSGGSGYTVAPLVNFTGGGGTGATAHAVLTGNVVTSVVVDSGGSGYTTAPTVSFITVPTVVITGGGGSNATATCSLLAGPSAGTSIACYAGRVWIGNNRTVYFTDVLSYYYMGGAGGAFTISDSTLHSNITSMQAANGFLYMFGVSSIDAVGDVRVSGGVTLFSRVNLTASVGTGFAPTVAPFGRNIEFMNRYGIYALRGAVARKDSDDIDGTINKIDFTSTVSGGQVSIFNQLCVAYLVNYQDTNGNRRILLIRSGDMNQKPKWFTASQGTALTLVTSAMVSDSPRLYATDGTNIYQMFGDSTNPVAVTCQSKLWDMGDPIVNHQAVKFGLSLAAPVTNFTLNYSIDTELISQSYTSSGESTVNWINNSSQIVTFINNLSQPLSWIVAGYIFIKNDVSNVGKYLGFTLTTTVPVSTFNAAMLEYINRTRW